MFTRVFGIAVGGKYGADLGGKTAMLGSGDVEHGSADALEDVYRG